VQYEGDSRRTDDDKNAGWKIYILRQSAKDGAPECFGLVERKQATTKTKATATATVDPPPAAKDEN
jgi:hypothetical protein